MKKFLPMLSVFMSGVLFATGFALAGVTKPETIISFLDFTGGWSPNMIITMVAAIVTTVIGYRLTLRRKAPLFAEKFGIPTRRDIDRRLVGGAAIFGFGWGLLGLCPGPAISSSVAGSSTVLIWLAAMVGGMVLYRVYDEAVKRAKERRVESVEDSPEVAA